MGTSKNGLPPFSPSDVQKTPTSTPDFGSGGRSLIPNQGYPAVGPILYALLQRIATAAANVAALQATVENDRADGQLVVTLDTYTLWVWKNADTTAADAAHIAPTDVGAGAGRFVNVLDAESSGGIQFRVLDARRGREPQHRCDHHGEHEDHARSHGGQRLDVAR